jgi:hypothetical protein
MRKYADECPLRVQSGRPSRIKRIDASAMKLKLGPLGRDVLPDG